MRCLVLPDIHLNHKDAERILKNDKPYDKVVFLGDYFDNFYDTPEQNIETAQWLKESLKDPKRIHLIGNHDINYHIHNKTLSCSGFSVEKRKAILSVLDKESDWRKLRWFDYEQGWLLTHAGLHNDLIPFPKQTKRTIEKFLIENSIIADRNLYSGHTHWFWHAGQARGGNHPVGGILWCDANTEFVGSPQLKQIFGHTYQKSHPTWLRGDTGLERYKTKKFTPNPNENWNLALDVALKYYAVIDDGKVTVHSTYE